MSTHPNPVSDSDEEEGRYKLPSLLALSEIASSLSTGTDVEALLGRYLSTMIRIAGAYAGAVRLVTPDGRHLRLVTSTGMPQDLVARERIVPIDCGVCGQALAARAQQCAHSFAACGTTGTHPFFAECGEMHAVPLRHKGQAIGVFNLFLRKAGALPADVRTLFGTIGEHLGMALDNARLTRENTRIGLVTERQMLANQVHDSLAQTLAYARMRAAAAGSALSSGDTGRVQRYLGELEAAIETAYGEVRGLIEQFREPMDPRGLSAALRDLIERVGERSTLRTEFINRAQDLALTPEQEVQVFHIVQEAMTNAQRHARASEIRLIIDRDGEYARLGIEDDGTGFDAARDGEPGHFGLSIMRERAARLGGELTVRSQSGSGTRIDLRFRIAP
ncbi:MAG: GAF domain-containing protein [Betaproteobacteria bacterium]|nr:GAF domain-containing protein [Betaproteobacteria bacterium]